MNYDFNDIEVTSHEMEIIEMACEKLNNASGQGSDLLGWRKSYDDYLKSQELEDIQITASHIRDTSEALIVLGIGGSYLGAKAVISSVLGEHYNNNADLKIYFGGNNISEENYLFLKDIIEKQEVSVIVISKSGKTLETMLGFELILQVLESKYKEDMYKKIYAITDSNSGILRKFADRHDIKTFAVPDDIGGRYSVFTSVGLLPLAAMKIDIEEFLRGAAAMQKKLAEIDFNSNPAMSYAASRYHMFCKGFSTEILLIYSPANLFLAEWWKQLFGESEGKCGKGLLPTSMTLTTDLHSLGQYLQDGKKTFFETHIFADSILNCKEIHDIKEYKSFKSELGLEHLDSKTFDELNKIAHNSVLKAHRYSGNINFCLGLQNNSAYEIGKLMYFFMESCAISAYALDVNPFNQNGVERYKSNMRDLM